MCLDRLFRVICLDRLFRVIYLDPLFRVLYLDSLFRFIYLDLLFQVIYLDPFCLFLFYTFCGHNTVISKFTEDNYFILTVKMFVSFTGS